MSYLEKYKVDVPEGVSGQWKIERFTVSEEAARFEKMRSIFSGGRGVPAGNYTWLKCNGEIVMSDTPDEIGDHLYAIGQAKGDVLINGLGLGMVLQAMARKPEVSSVTVIEKSPDVIALVATHYQVVFGDKIKIVQADALEYKPEKGKRFGVVWHDIWNDICSDNLEEMKRLHRRYGRFAEWQGSWGRDICERYRLFNNRPWS